MAQVWVVKPGEEGKLPGLEVEAARLQRELADIEALSDATACRLCGVQDTLTEEHTPSKRAGKIGRMIRGIVDYAASIARGSVHWRGEPIQGVKREALCAPCNNRTGSWYNPAYVRFVNDCRAAARPDNAGRVCEIRTTAYRQRVAKQALTSIVSTCQPGLTARYPDLRALLVGKEDSRAIAPLRLWHYLRANPGGVSTGITIAMNMERQTGHLVAGFSFWPLGWILTIGDITVEGGVNVTDWTRLGYHDNAPVTVEIPCQWAISVYPADFRGPEDSPDEAWTTKPIS